uniref:Branched-chain amino acid transport system permease protein n=1 Tax=uncultured prokaryote TaxID=198431 RepID=H5SIP5_9ZZZZ|nr:branched-chain amino acid transport system permease protein [uncultured prokaryote]
MSTVLIIILADGLVFASWLFLISLGLTLIYGVLRILNIAHGSLYALGAYTGAVLIIAYFDSDKWWPPGSFVVLLGAALLVGLVAGPLIERGVLRWMYGRDPAVQLIVTYALFLILEDSIKLGFGVDPYYAYKPFGLLGKVQLAGVSYPYYYLLLLIVAILAGGLLWVLINRTRFGRLVVAVIHDPEISTALGINLPVIYVVTFTLGATLAALGGAFTAPMIAVVPGIAVEVIVLAFAVVVIGGLGSPEGAALGALVVGLVRAAAVHLIPELELFTIYLVMTVVLLIRPQGLFPQVEVRRI